MSFETEQYEAPSLAVLGELHELTMKKIPVTPLKLTSGIPDGVKVFPHGPALANS